MSQDPTPQEDCIDPAKSRVPPREKEEGKAM